MLSLKVATIITLDLVVKRGEMKEDVKELVKDFRDVFYPYTATKINVRL